MVSRLFCLFIGQNSKLIIVSIPNFWEVNCAFQIEKDRVFRTLLENPLDSEENIKNYSKLVEYSNTRGSLVS